MDEAALRRIQLFDGLSRKQRKLLAMRVDEVDVPAGKVLCCKGKTADEFFVIEEGTAKVVRDGQYLDALGPGDFFGEMGLLDDEPRNADVIAETPLTVIVLRGPALKELERDAPRLARRLRRSVQQRREWLEPVS
jgi:CRP-like cAMP-binding protein